MLISSICIRSVGVLIVFYFEGSVRKWTKVADRPGVSWKWKSWRWKTKRKPRVPRAKYTQCSAKMPLVPSGPTQLGQLVSICPFPVGGLFSRLTPTTVTTGTKPFTFTEGFPCLFIYLLVCLSPGFLCVCRPGYLQLTEIHLLCVQSAGIKAGTTPIATLSLKSGSDSKTSGCIRGLHVMPSTYPLPKMSHFMLRE